MPPIKKSFAVAFGLISKQLSSLFDYDEDLVDDDLMDIMVKNPNEKKKLLKALDNSEGKIKIEIKQNKVKLIS